MKVNAVGFGTAVRPGGNGTVIIQNDIDIVSFPGINAIFTLDPQFFVFSDALLLRLKKLLFIHGAFLVSGDIGRLAHGISIQCLVIDSLPLFPVIEVADFCLNLLILLCGRLHLSIVYGDIFCISVLILHRISLCLRSQRESCQGSHCRQYC